MLYFKMKRFLLYITFSSGSSYSTAYNFWSFCDRSKLCVVLEWSVNVVSETCYFNLKYVLKKSQIKLFNKSLMIVQGVVENVTKMTPKWY